MPTSSEYLNRDARDRHPEDRHSARGRSVQQPLQFDGADVVGSKEVRRNEQQANAGLVQRRLDLFRPVLADRDEVVAPDLQQATIARGCEHDLERVAPLLVRVRVAHEDVVAFGVSHFAVRSVGAVILPVRRGSRHAANCHSRRPTIPGENA
jgi:hypothetical protein